MLQVQVLFFGGLREALGCRVLDITGGESGADGPTLSLLEIERRIAQLYPRFESLRGGVRIAVNESFVETTEASDVLLRDGDVVAYIPPVTGG